MLTVQSLLNMLYEHRDVPFLRDIRGSLEHNMDKRCNTVKIAQYVFHRKPGEQTKTSIEKRDMNIDIERYGYTGLPIIEALQGLNNHHFNGLRVSDDRLFAIDVSHERDKHSINIHTIPSQNVIKPSAWMRLAHKYLDMHTNNCSVVIVYDANDATTVHGKRYPDFIEKGVDVLLENGAVPLFWYVDTNPRYGRHLYLFIANDPYFVKTFTIVRTKTWVK